MTLAVIVTARKGGVGKSGIATTLASVFASTGYTVLLVDLDTQSLAALALGADPLLGGAAHWLATGDVPEQCVQEPQPGLRLLAGGPELESISSVDTSELAHALARIPADLVIFDTAAGTNACTRAALEVADITLVLTDPHPLGLSGAATLLSALDKEKLRALIVSRLDVRRALHRDVEAGVANAFAGEKVFTVHNDARLERALAEGASTAALQHSKAVEDITAIAAWILEMSTAC